MKKSAVGENDFAMSLSPRNNNKIKTKGLGFICCTWSPAPISSSCRSICTPSAIFGDCCSSAISRLHDRQSKPNNVQFSIHRDRQRETAPLVNSITAFVHSPNGVERKQQIFRRDRKKVAASKTPAHNTHKGPKGRDLTLTNRTNDNYLLTSHRSQCAWLCPEPLSDSRRPLCWWFRRTIESCQFWQPFLEERKTIDRLVGSRIGQRARAYSPQATFAFGSCFKCASKTASLIWSHILSENNNKSHSLIGRMRKRNIFWVCIIHW